MKDYTRVAAEIDLDSIYENLAAMKRNLAEGVKICAVIKTDGYGHGAVPIARKIDELSDFYAVATIDEAVNLRRHQIDKPILVLGCIPSGRYEDAVRLSIRINVFSIEIAEAVSETAVRLGIPAMVHLKLDTGMGRLGFWPDESSVAEVVRITQMPGIVTEGIFSHFARADEAEKRWADEQQRRYQWFLDELEKCGIRIPLRHLCNSAGIIDLNSYGYDMVRAGISLYGMYPSDQVGRTQVVLTPALSLKSHIILVKTVPAGRGISYGSTYVTEKEMKIATIPVGYGDGYPRLLSGKGQVLVRGKRAPILGRICMDQFMVDVTGIEGAAAGDEVVLIGKSGQEEITADELAKLTGTISYEIVCGLGKRIPRIYYENGNVIGVKDYYDDDYCFCEP